MSDKKKTHPFQPINEPKADITDYQKESDIYIISFEEYDAVKVLGEKETDFLLEKKVREASRVNRQDFITEQSYDVGIMNVLEKVRTTGDISLLNQTSRDPIPPSGEKDSLGRPLEALNDITGLPGNKIDAMKMVEAGYQAFGQVPEDLKGHKTYSEVAQLTQAEFDKYLEKLKAVHESAKEGQENGK